MTTINELREENERLNDLNVKLLQTLIPLIRFALDYLNDHPLPEESEPPDIMPRINGVSQRCDCGANVFRYIKRSNKTRLMCNGCQQTYTVER